MKRSSTRWAAGARAALATILLIPLVSVQARGNDATARKVMQELYELSGLESQIDSIADLVSQGLAQQPGRIPPQTRAAVERALRRAYDAGELEKAVLADLEGRHDARHAAGALAWLRSPLGRRIAHIEAESATTAGAHALEEFARALQENPPRPERLALEQRFDAALQNTASMVELTIATSIGIAIALDATHPVDRRSDPEQMRSDVENQRAELHSMLRPNSVVAFLYIYRELSDEEIDAYIAFGETDAGRWYTDSMMGAFVAAITSASRSIAGEPGAERGASDRRASQRTATDATSTSESSMTSPSKTKRPLKDSPAIRSGSQMRSSSHISS
jgi:hypothetical protein